MAPSGARREHFWGISCEKSRFYAKKIIFFPIYGGGARRVRLPLDPPLVTEPYWLVSVLSSDPDTILKSYTITDDSGLLWLKLTSWFHGKGFINIK